MTGTLHCVSVPRRVCCLQRYTGHIVFEFEGHEELLEVHVFRATEYVGCPTETEEMTPQWYPEDGIPFEGMWADDVYWLPLLLASQCFEAYFLFRGEATIVRHELRVVAGFPAGAGDARPVSATQGPIVIKSLLS